jgi:Cu2+-exporting ATPase
MHPEIIQEGRAPVPPAEWVPMEPTESEDNKAFLDLWRKMKIAIVLRCLFYHRDVRNDT